MGTHAFALSITFFAFLLIRRYEYSEKLAFGSAKFSPLAGFASAILLALSGVWILYESAERFFNPLEINFNEALAVAVIGLAVNALCAFIMGAHPHHGHSHPHGQKEKAAREDFNFKSAYLHILADALTSLLAIAALTLGKYAGLNFLDSLVGFLGGGLICSWAFGLIKATGKILADYENPALKKDISARLKEAGADIEYLHIWDTGRGKYAAVLKCSGEKSAQEIKAIISSEAEFDLINIEKTI